jgi:patatin-like phospholipase domain-containing protein 2
MTSDFFRIVNEARSHSLGPFSPSFNIQTCILEGMQRAMPEDAHLRVNGKVHISLTRVYDGKNIIVSQFNSRDDLLQALLCACFIPGRIFYYHCYIIVIFILTFYCIGFSGFIPPKFHGVRYMDGAFSDNLPTLDENTVTVSPFAGETDICPRDDSAQIFHVSCSNAQLDISHYHLLNIAVKPVKYKHRSEQAEHLPVHEDPVPAEARDSVEYVPAGLR